MNIVYGLLFMITGIVIILAQAGIVTLVYPIVWPLLLMLIGLYMVLSSQRKIVERSEQRKAAKHEAKINKKHEKETQKTAKRVEKVIEKKEAIISKQAGRIEKKINKDQ